MYAAAVFLPLIGSIIAGVLAFVPKGGHGHAHGHGHGHDEHGVDKIDQAAQYVTCGAMLLASIAALVAFIDIVVAGHQGPVELFTWIDSGALEITWGLRADTLSLTMVLMVTVVSSKIGRAHV